MDATAWLHTAALVSIGLGLTCAAFVAADEYRRPQAMWIMNLVWPLTALFGTVLTLAAYRRYGRAPEGRDHEHAGSHARHDDRHDDHHSGGHDGHHGGHRGRGSPFPVAVGKGTLHCGSGCTLGDIVAEWLAFLVPAVAVWFGWRWVFAEKIFAVWALDYVFAFAIGIAFQYFTIKPMRDVSAGRALIAAVKADAASLTAWQVGMYGFMAFANFYLFRDVLGLGLRVDSAEFWLVMQIAMLCGFVTSYPVNWWLIRKGVKEAM